MITTEQAAELRRLIEECADAQNNHDAEMMCGHAWEAYGAILVEAQTDLNNFIDSITEQE